MLAWSCQPGWCQTADPGPPQPPSGNEIVQQSAARLLEISSLEVRLRQRIDMFGQHLVGSGLYMQKSDPDSDGVLLSLELKVQVGDELATLQHIGDGRFLWVRQTLPGESHLGRVDLDRFRAAVEKSGRAPVGGSPGSWMAIGGLPRLLSGLAENFDFVTVGRTTLVESPTWVISGRWKSGLLIALLPDQKERIENGVGPDLTKLPEHLPTGVRMAVGQQDRLPYRIEYLRPSADPQEPDQPIVVLELTEIRQRDDLPQNQFTYQPGDQPVADYTGLYLKNLGLAP